MASLLARAAAAAASLPSGRSRRLGSGRLTLAPALPGQGAPLMLAGRRVGAGQGGVLAVQFMGPARDGFKAACAKGGSGTDPDSIEDTDDLFERKYIAQSKKIEMMLGLFIPLPRPLSMEEKAVQEKLKDIGERCVALAIDTMRRLPPAERHRFENVFWMAHLVFAAVRSRATDERGGMAMAFAIAEKLDVVRKMVSSACGVPLPVDMKKDSKMMMPFLDIPVFPKEGLEALVFAMLDNQYSTVKRDIDVMISASQK